MILVQIDGLSRPELQRALDSGRMPFLRKLLRHEGYCLESLYSGVPATTPAVQAELFYGVKTAVPAFSYFNRRLGRVVRMVEAEAAEEVQSHLESNPDNLFEAGSACTNIYTGGAAEPRFCAAASGWGALFGRATLLGILLFALVNCWNVLRAICLTLLELVKGIAAALWGSLQGFNLWSEIKFIPSRVAVGVLLRDLATMAACMDTTRGLPIIQLNFLGYDEHAHRRGPESEFAQKSLRGIDRCIERLWRAGHESTARMYSLWVYADHGQESSTPYEEITGRTIADVVAEFTGALKAVPETPPKRRARRPGRAERVRYLRRSSAAKGTSTTNDKEPLHDPEVVAIGPLGHLYFQTPRSEEYLAGLAQHLTMKAKVPLALLLSEDAIFAWTPNGRFTLPADAAEVFGSEHPFLSALPEDLLKLLRHPDAGNLVIGGWSHNQRPVSFVGENGAHAGVGPKETHAFVLLPSYVRASGVGSTPLRSLDLRDAALRYMGRATASHGARATPHTRRVRVVTYNVHSCMGLDERLSPARIARVLAHCQADIIALQEIDVRRARSGHVDQAEEIATRLGMHVMFFPAVARKGEQYGDALLSYYPIRVVKSAGLPGLPGRSLEPRGVLWATVDVLGQPLQVMNTHLGLVAAERQRQVEALLGPEWLGHPDCHGPIILCGDLNMSPRSENFGRLTTRLRDVQRSVEGHRPLGTWLSYWPWFRIDHVLVSEECRVEGVQTIRSRLAREASDHLPLVVDLVVT